MRLLCVWCNAICAEYTGGDELLKAVDSWMWRWNVALHSRFGSIEERRELDERYLGLDLSKVWRPTPHITCHFVDDNFYRLMIKSTASKYCRRVLRISPCPLQLFTIIQHACKYNRRQRKHKQKIKHTQRNVRTVSEPSDVKQNPAKQN